MRNGSIAFRKLYETFKALTTSFVSYRTTLPREHTIDRYKRPSHLTSIGDKLDKALTDNANIFRDTKYFDTSITRYVYERTYADVFSAYLFGFKLKKKCI